MSVNHSSEEDRSRFLGALGSFIARRWILVATVSLLLIAASVMGARNMRMETGTRTFISPESDIYKDLEKYRANFGRDAIVVLVTARDPQQLVKNLPAIDRLETGLDQNVSVLSVTGPAFAIKQALAQRSGSPALPTDPEKLKAMVLDPATGQVRLQFARLFPQGRYAIVLVTPKGNLEGEALRTVVDDVVHAVGKVGFSNDVTPKVTGMPAFSSKMQDMMRTAMRDMLLVAALLMLVVLALTFSVHGLFFRRWLPVGIVLVGSVYTFGIMGLLSVPMSMVSMAAFPILIGLGIDYAIQFHSRYDEEMKKGARPAEAIATSLHHMAPAVGIALFATGLGFVALFISPVTMIRDFGHMLLIGVIVCYVTAVFLLLSILYRLDQRATSRRNDIAASAVTRVGWLERRLGDLARVVIRRPLAITLVALALTVGGFIADSHVVTETNELKFVSQETPEIKDLMSLRNLVGGFLTANLMVEAPDVAEPSVMRWMLEFEQWIKKQHGNVVAGASSLPDLVVQANAGKIPGSSAQIKALLDRLPKQMKANLVNEDYTLASVNFTLRDVGIDRLRAFRAAIASELEKAPGGQRAVLTGTPVAMTEMFHALTRGRLEMTLLGAALIFAGLLVVVFRRQWLKAVLAVFPIGLIVGWSSGVMYLLGIKYTLLTATLGALIIGIGTEYTILIMMRYDEERRRGERPFEAMTTAITRIGRAIMASGLTTVAGFGSLLAAGNFPILRDFGIVTLLDVAFALISSLVVLPSLIVWVDSRQERRRPAARAM